jgi:hypothetical protein
MAMSRLIEEKAKLLKKPFEAICIKPFNCNRETDAWGCVEMFKIYKFTQRFEPGIFLTTVKIVMDFGDCSIGKYLSGFQVASSIERCKDDTVPTFREHFKIIK